MTVSNRKSRRAGRVVALGMAGALALGLMPGVAGAVARDTDDSCPVGAAPDSGFTDTEGSLAEAEIDCIVEYGLSSGTTATTYSPLANVNRGQMASFIMRKLDLVTGYVRPATPPDAFDDDDGSIHEDNINDVAAEGIALGDAGGNFNPTANVTRGQMATFLVGQLDTAGITLPVTPADAFDDDDGDVHEDNINIIADATVALAAGDAAGDYNPTDPVLRQQMALFLARDLDLLVEDGSVTVIADTADPTSVDARFNNVTGLALAVDTTDTITLTFGEAMAVPAPGDSVRLLDADGSTFDLICNAAGPGTTCVASAAGAVITVTVGTAGAVSFNQVVAGTVPGLQIPATVTDQFGYTDPATNGWDIAGSADKIVDVEA